MTTSAPAASEAKTGPRQWFAVVILALPTLLIAMDNTVLFMAVPHITADLRASSTEMLWIQDIYLFFVAGFLITMGTLGDRVGRKRVLLTGAGVFGAVSVVAAYSTNPGMLIVTRGVLGIAGATMAPTILGLLREMFPDQKQRTRAISIVMTCFMAGGTIGPVVGGMLLDRFWWGSAFLIGVPVMLLTFVLGPLLLPEYRDTGAGRLDLTSVVLSLAAVLPIIYGLKEIARDTAVEPGSAVALVVGVAFAAAFVYRQNRLASPLLELRLFKGRAFSGALGTLMVGQFMMGGTLFLLSQYLQLVLAKSPIAAGLWLLPATAVMALAALVVPPLAGKFRRERIIASGLLIAAAGFVLFALADPDGGQAFLIAGMFLAFGGTAPLLLLMIDLVIATVPPQKAGMAGAMQEASSQFGLAVGIAALGSAAAVVYRDDLEGALPSGLPDETAGAIRESLVGALTAAGSLPGQVGTEVAATARDAFTSGFNAVGLIGAVVVVCGSLAVATLLRNVRPRSEEDEEIEHAPEDEASVRG